MSRSKPDGILTLYQSEELDNASGLLGVLCLIHGSLLFSTAGFLLLVIKAGHGILDYRTSIDLPWLCASSVLPGLALLAAGILAVRRQNLGHVAILFALAILSEQIWAVHCLSTGPRTASLFIFGRPIVVTAHSWLVLPLILHRSWLLLCLLLAVLVSMMKGTWPSWRIVAACWLAGQLARTLSLPLGIWGPRPPIFQAVWLLSNEVLLPLLCFIFLIWRPRAVLYSMLLLLVLHLIVSGSSWFEVLTPGSKFARGGNVATTAMSYIQILLIQPLHQLLPLLFIVWNGWRWRHAPLPDDGSPWPRRYCGKCYYNLHGLEADRCPECGAVLGQNMLPGGRLVLAKNP